MNEALVRIDSLVQPSVLDERSDPPPEPVDGDCHIVGPAPVGTWSEQAGALAVWAGNQWLFAAPIAGSLVFDRASGSYAVYDPDDGWRRAATPPRPTAGRRKTRRRAAR